MVAVLRIECDAEARQDAGVELIPKPAPACFDARAFGAGQLPSIAPTASRRLLRHRMLLCNHDGMLRRLRSALCRMRPALAVGGGLIDASWRQQGGRVERS